MATNQTAIRVTRWRGSQHPTLSSITRQMRKEGLRPYQWNDAPNTRYAVRSHRYDKVVYVVEGTLELTAPDGNQRVRLRAGDRVDVPAGMRHGMIVGSSGAVCVEAALRAAPRRQAE